MFVQEFMKFVNLVVTFTNVTETRGKKMESQK